MTGTCKSRKAKSAKFISKAEITVIKALAEFEKKNGRKKGMPTDRLAEQTEMTWPQLMPILKKLGKKKFIEKYKGENYTQRWFPVEFDKELARLMGSNYQYSFKFRLTATGRSFAGLLKPKPKTGPDDLMPTYLVIHRYIVSRSTLMRALNNGRLTSYRPAGARSNTTHLFSEADIARLFQKKKKR